MTGKERGVGVGVGRAHHERTSACISLFGVLLLRVGKRGGGGGWGGSIVRTSACISLFGVLLLRVGKYNAACVWGGAGRIMNERQPV